MIKIVKEKISEKTYSELSKKYNISEGNIKTWIRRYTYKDYVTRDKQDVKKELKNLTIEELIIEVDILKRHAIVFYYVSTKWITTSLI